MSTPALVPFTQLSDLDPFKAGGFPPDYPADLRTFYAPVDRPHDVLAAVVASARTSLVLSMYAFDDRQLADIVKAKLSDPGVTVQITLDSSQALYTTEKRILEAEAYPATSIAIGTSELGSIIHLKEIVVDGRWRISGSTNWSHSGEYDQDNELTVVDSVPAAMEATARINAVHQYILDHEPPFAGG